MIVLCSAIVTPTRSDHEWYELIFCAIFRRNMLLFGTAWFRKPAFIYCYCEVVSDCKNSLEYSSLRCCAVSVGKRLPIFRGLVVPSSLRPGFGQHGPEVEGSIKYRRHSFVAGIVRYLSLDQCVFRLQYFPDHIALSSEVCHLISSTHTSSWRGADVSKERPLVSQTMYKTCFLNGHFRIRAHFVLGKH